MKFGFNLKEGWVCTLVNRFRNVPLPDVRDSTQHRVASNTNIKVINFFGIDGQ